jgi:hypothetical protein
MILSAGVVNPIDDPVEAKILAEELAEKAQREKNESNA